MSTIIINTNNDVPMDLEALKLQFYHNFKQFIYDYLTKDIDGVIPLHMAYEFLMEHDEELKEQVNKILEQHNEGNDEDGEYLIPDEIWLENYAIQESGLNDEINELKEKMSQI